MVNTFGKNIIPEDEFLRLKALDYYNVLKDLSNRYFTNLAHIVATTFNTPVAIVSIVAKDMVHFKGIVGMDEDMVDRGVSLCSLAILENQPTIFNNALEEPCLLSNPNVAGDFGLRFYAGAPITTPEGYNIGTVCVIDKKPREFSEHEKKLLIQFAETVMIEIINRKDNLGVVANTN